MNDLLPNEHYAEDDNAEAQAEAHYEAQLEGGEIDNAYDRMRDDDSLFLMENVKEVVDKCKNLSYFKNRTESLGKDLIECVLFELDLKIKEIRDLTPTFQIVELMKKEEKNGN